MKYRILLIPLLLLASLCAAGVGMGVGNLMYDMDKGLIDNIDTNSFKSTINASFPIIDTIYNSGNASVSFSGEIKNLIEGVFGFNIDAPYTILNVQSPLFLSYYNNIYRPKLPGDGTEYADKGGSANDGGNTNNGSNGNNGSAPSGDKSGSGGVPPGNGTPGGNTDGTNPENSSGNDPQGGTNAGNNGSTAHGGTDGTIPGPGSGKANLPQPASSITYEPEDEEEQEQSEIVSHGKLVIQNYSKFKVNIEQLMRESFNIKFDKKGPKVLIYHTHTTESYVLKASDQGKRGVPSYNLDPRYNVVRVGEELSRNLRKYGIDVLHNGTIHDTNRNSAYGVAIKTVERYEKSYPSIKVFLDIHRDGLELTKPKLDIDKKIKGKTAAQVMFVVGTNGMLPHPEWRENLKFALHLQQYLNEKYPGLARPIWIVNKRYNQHVSDDALIIEIGGDGNLLSESLESTKYVAEALNAVMNKK